MIRHLFLCLLLSVGFRATAASLLDASWTSGQLENGLRYFIKSNPEPQERIELRLVVNAGSILEAEDQRGLAHYLEHMAFNGTTHFEKDALVSFLESLGVAFGPDLNAYTSFDETVYMLRLPTEDPEVVDKAFLVLSDWAGGIQNTDEELEAERGVILEERRGRRGADARIRDQQIPLLFKDSRYAERLPIGTVEVLEGFDFDRLREFYRDWYRPELMSVIAVGDLDVEETRARIERHFADLSNPDDAVERKVYLHPPADEPRAGLFTDPELTETSIALVWNHPPRPVSSVEAFLRQAEESLVADMISQRFQELALQAEAPFLEAQAYAGGYTRAGHVLYVYAQVKEEEGAILEGGQALRREIERALRHGFTPGELERAVARRLRLAKELVAEKDTTDSAQIAREMVRHALEDEVVLGPEKELALLSEALPQMTQEKTLEILNDWMDTGNKVVLATAPEAADSPARPTEDALLSILTEPVSEPVEPYVDTLADAALVEVLPEPGSIVSTEEDEALGLTTWTLSNGATVVVKPTDFKQDEILVQAWGPGGWAEVSDEQWPAVRMADAVASVTGVGPFSMLDLAKLLSGKKVQLTPFIRDDQHGFTASASPKDLETLMQLIHVGLTDVREDPVAFLFLKNRIKASLRNRDADPASVFRDLATVTMTNYHPRKRPMTLEDVEALDMTASLEYFRQRFSNAGNLTLFIVGNVDLKTLQPLVLRWLASLPGEAVPTERTFLEVDFPNFETQRTLRMGLEPVSEIRMMWMVDGGEWNYAERHALESMVAALRLRLREQLREEEGGTYHASAWKKFRHYPTPQKQVRIRFGCDPARVDELIAEVNKLVEELSTTPLEDRYIHTVKQTQLRKRETDLRENSFWAYVIPFYAWHEEDPHVLLEFEDYVNTVDAALIQETAAEMFSTPHKAVLILRPGEEENDGSMD